MRERDGGRRGEEAIRISSAKYRGGGGGGGGGMMAHGCIVQTCSLSHTSSDKMFT